MKREKKWSIIYFTIIGAVFLFTRVYKLTQVPNGMHIDEISIGYNAWTLSQFGVDRYNVSFPVYFDNAGSGQSGLYIYMVALFSKLFGYNMITLRLPAVLFGALLLIFLTLTAYEMFGIKSAYVTSAIVTIMPVFVMSERFAFDCNAFLPMFAMFLYFAVRLLKTQKARYAVFLGISISLCFYSYILSFIILPIFLIISIIYCLIYKKVSIKNVVLSGITAFIPSIPILSYILVIFGLVKPFKIGNLSITDASFQRISELGWQNRSFKAILKSLFEITDHDSYNFVADERFGVFYSNRLFGFSLSQILILCSFVAIAVLCFLKNRRKEFNYETILLFACASTLSPIFFTEGFATYRYESFLVVCALILAYGLSLLWGREQRILSGLLAFLFLCNFISYSAYLFGDSFTENDKLAYFDTELLELCENMNLSEYKDYQIYVDDTTTYNTGLIILYGLKVPPSNTFNKAENADMPETEYDNIHIGIPETIKNEKAIYIIRDMSAGASLYTDVKEPMKLYEGLIRNNKAKRALMALGAEEKVYNDYYIFFCY